MATPVSSSSKISSPSPRPATLAASTATEAGANSKTGKSHNPLTYPKADAPVSHRLFQQPTTEYRNGDANVLAPVPACERPVCRQSVDLCRVDLVEGERSDPAPNTLILDYARYWVPPYDEWSGVQEIHAINNQILNGLELPRKVALWYEFISHFEVDDITYLALKMPEGVTIKINSTRIALDGTIRPGEDRAWSVDEAIATIPIPAGTFHVGINDLQMTFPLGNPIGRMYLLGKFTVDTPIGLDPQVLARARIMPFKDPPHYKDELFGRWPPKPDERRPLCWGDVTTQGLPFYVGDLVYRGSVRIDGRARVTLVVPEFRSPLLKVWWENKGVWSTGHIASESRTLDLGVLAPGHRSIHITACGDRYNAFGHVHALQPDVGIPSWAWTDEYNVWPFGILKCPHVLTQELAPDEKVIPEPRMRPDPAILGKPPVNGYSYTPGCGSECSGMPRIMRPSTSVCEGPTSSRTGEHGRHTPAGSVLDGDPSPRRSPSVALATHVATAERTERQFELPLPKRHTDGEEQRPRTLVDHLRGLWDNQDSPPSGQSTWKHMITLECHGSKSSGDKSSGDGLELDERDVRRFIGGFFFEEEQEEKEEEEKRDAEGGVSGNNGSETGDKEDRQDDTASDERIA